jgi:hypothetical protein
MRSAARSLISRAEFDPETYCRAPPLPHLDQGICVVPVDTVACGKTSCRGDALRRPSAAASPPARGRGGASPLQTTTGSADHGQRVPVSAILRCGLSGASSSAESGFRLGTLNRSRAGVPGS